MSNATKFPNAPIAEAILDIRVEPCPETDVTALAALHDILRERFPHSQGLTEWRADFQVEAGTITTSAQASARPSGFLFRSDDQSRIVQTTLTGFTFNRLKPYESWDRFRDEARRIWEEYVRVARPSKALRVALRYINRIELPLPCDDLKNYILTVPETAPGLPQGLSHFFMRLEMPHPDFDCLAVITETIDREAMTAEIAPIIFDIDVFRMSAYDPVSAGIWETLETLRLAKNRIFFSSLTEKAKELFK